MRSNSDASLTSLHAPASKIRLEGCLDRRGAETGSLGPTVLSVAPSESVDDSTNDLVPIHRFVPIDEL